MNVEEHDKKEGTGKAGKKGTYVHQSFSDLQDGCNQVEMTIDSI